MRTRIPIILLLTREKRELYPLRKSHHEGRLGPRVEGHDVEGADVGLGPDGGLHVHHQRVLGHQAMVPRGGVHQIELGGGWGERGNKR